MDIKEEMSNGVMQDALSIDEMEDKDEVILRRMKNRERQRRYRERKRMREEAGIDESLSFEEEANMGKLEEVEVEECDNGYVENFARRVYCDRDWKKEARIAHLVMDKSRDGMVIWKVKPSRRDWKAEARMKKT